MEEGEGGAAGEEAELTKLDCEVVGGEGGGRGNEVCDRRAEGEDDAGWGVSSLAPAVIGRG